jgi:ribulose-phosphate 3-epimerase
MNATVNKEVLLAPSLLAANHAALGDALLQVARTGLRWAHLDIMDGHFVPNISFGPKTVADLRNLAPDLYFDTHLMLSEPHRYIEAFANAGSNGITVHVEPRYPIRETLRRIRGLGIAAGIALNPETQLDNVYELLEEIDLALVMTVHPGFGGQHFIGSVIEKIVALDKWRRENNAPYRIEVDGGIDATTAQICRRAGADTLVAGTSFFRATDKRAFANAIVAGAM